MNSKPLQKGFTLIELLVVIGLMAIVLGLSVPFVTSLRSDVSLRKTLKQVETDVVSTLNYSLAGKSFAAISSGDLVESELIPAAYLLHFQVSEEGDQYPYIYFELADNGGGQENPMTITYQKNKDFPGSSVFLKQIELISRVDQVSESVQSASILIQPPFGRVSFIELGTENLGTFTEQILYDDQKYDEIRLSFQYKDDEKNLSHFKFNTSKLLNY